MHGILVQTKGCQEDAPRERRASEVTSIQTIIMDVTPLRHGRLLHLCINAPPESHLRNPSPMPRAHIPTGTLASKPRSSCACACQQFMHTLRVNPLVPVPYQHLVSDSLVGLGMSLLATRYRPSPLRAHLPSPLTVGEGNRCSYCHHRHLLEMLLATLSGPSGLAARSPLPFPYLSLLRKGGSSPSSLD